MARYRCLECGEEIEVDVGCQNHHLEKGHEDFELIGTEVKINIKSP